jgi:acetyl-CoA synthetase
MSADFDFGGEIVWRPSPEIIERANLTRFMRMHDIEDFDSLLERAASDVAWFTEAVVDFLGIRFRKPYERIVDLSRGIAWPRWCPGGVMNITDTCLDKHLATPTAQSLALIWEGEEGTSVALTYAELARDVNRMANALRALGLGKDDSIGLFMPMTPEVVIALLAIAKIGAVILPLFSGYGAGAVANRLADAGARALITADGFPRRGRVVPMKQTADSAAARVPTLKHMIILRRTGVMVDMQSGRDHWWHDIIESQSDKAEAESTSAQDLLMIIYTSGTTGRPKGAVHTHCGFPIKAAQDMAFGMDVHPGDRVYWMTDMGWMMGPWLVFGALLLGATCVIYDGAPDHPAPDRVWRLVERHRINSLGLSPTFVRALLTHGEEPVKRHDLSSLRLFGSTGEPWNPQPWMWLFDVVGASRLPIINYSGGTEISGGILMGNPILPLKPCAFSAPCPGISADVFDENGQPIRGKVGELVIKAPWIGMTRGFWKDPDRYERTYWSRWPDVWVHGDWAAVDNDGMWYIFGRSDDTIKVAGKRLGPAEIESVLVDHPAVVEAAAIAIPDPIKGGALVCFCVLAGDGDAAGLEAKLIDLVTGELGKPLAPRAIYFVADLPKTRNAKVMRRILRSTFLGEDPGDTSSLVNPDCLEAIRRIRQDRS